jgi:hypothetical protein
MSFGMNGRTERILGQDSILLETPSVRLALTRVGAHLAPVTFFPQDARPIAPYAIAPWAEESLPGEVPSVIAVLRGDFFCSAFGANVEPYRGQRLPLHGETANSKWAVIDGGETNVGCWLRIGIDLPLQGGRCEATTALMSEHTLVYQRHDLSGLTGAINPGHHAILAFPEAEGRGHLSFSHLIYARTHLESTERPENRGDSCLKPDVEITDLRAVPCIDGGVTDLTRYPARRGFEDIVILCTAPQVELGWSALTFPEEGYVWFALRDPRQLSCTLLWFSNGGRHFAPWNGRHVNVMGVEDMTGFFHLGLAASARPNLLTVRGIRTCLERPADGRLSIPYIQGVARIPGTFDRVATIEACEDRQGIFICGDSGAVVEVPCEVDFLRTGRLSGFCM